MRTLLVILAILFLVALLFLGLTMWVRQYQRQLARAERLQAEKEWDGICQFENPETGVQCQRHEFHLEHHYRDTPNGLVTW